MAQNAFGMASLYDPSIAVDQQQLDRQQALAQALRKMSLDASGGTKMAGAVAIRNSPLEGLAKVLQGYQASQMEAQGDTQRAEMSKKQAAAMVPLLRGLMGEGDAVAPQAPVAQAPMGGGGPGPGDTGPAMPPQAAPTPPAADPKAQLKRAAMSALLSGNTELANKLIANMMEQTPDMKNMAAMGQDPRLMGQLGTAKARKEGLMDVSPGNTVFDPSSGQAAFSAPQAPSPQVKEVTEALKAAGIDPASPQGQQVFAQLASKAASHQPATQVSVNTEKGYAGHIASGLATQDLAVIEAGRGAPERIQSARNIKEILDKNPITGTAAETRLGITKAFATAGLIDGKRVKTTEDLASALASGTLDAIKTSGLGSGQGFTDKDRQFLEKARSGNIEINSGTLRTLADLNERTAVAAANKANVIIKKLKGNTSMGGVGTSLNEIALPSAAPRIVDW